MQIFHWLIAYPEMMKKAIPITGTSKLTSHDLLFCMTALAVLQEMPVEQIWDGRSKNVLAGMQALVSYTPDYFLTSNDPGEIPTFLEKMGTDMERHDPNDLAWQLKAIKKHNVFAVSGKTVKDTRAEVCMVLSERDRMVNPKPAWNLPN